MEDTVYRTAPREFSVNMNIVKKIIKIIKM